MTEMTFLLRRARRAFCTGEGQAHTGTEIGLMRNSGLLWTFTSIDMNIYVVWYDRLRIHQVLLVSMHGLALHQSPRGT